MVFALLVGLGMLLVTQLCYALATALIVHLIVPLTRKEYAGLGLWKNVAIMMLVSLITAAVHLVQIALWALALFTCGEISSFESAIYCSAQNYTALGYGDVILSERWRLLGPLEAINGLLLFGLSTALMFAIMSRLIANRLNLHPRHHDEGAMIREAGGARAGDTGGTTSDGNATRSRGSHRGSET